jgi:hypothetical protein
MPPCLCGWSATVTARYTATLHFRRWLLARRINNLGVTIKSKSIFLTYVTKISKMVSLQVEGDDDDEGKEERTAGRIHQSLDG